MSKKKNKETKPIISIIVPTHNVEKYIKKCLTSLLEQSFDKIEIICVDDNSEDGTFPLLEEYAAKDKRLKVYKNPGNGVSVARNHGLDQAYGKYIMFCDGDDYYDTEMCEKMLNAIEQNRADMAICEINTIYQSHPERRFFDEAYYNLKFTGLQKMNRRILQQVDNSPTNKIFRKSTIDKYHIRFPEGRIYEDAYFSYVYFCTCKNIFFLDERLYHYVRHAGSIMTITWSREDARDTAIDHLYITIDIYNFLKKHGLFEQYAKEYWERFQAYEWLAIDMAKSKAAKKKARNLATEFILAHSEDFRKAEYGARNAIIRMTPKLWPRDPSLCKRAFLKFLPTYRAQIQSIWRMEALVNRNEELLKELNQLLKK